MIVKGRRIIPRGFLVAVTAAIVLAMAAPGAGANEPMLVQPDGGIVLTGQLWPSFAALARLTPDGKLDPSFGTGGFVVDRRLSALTALAQRPDGRIVAAGVGGFRLAQYLPNGEPDPGFAGGGVGGTDVPSESDFSYADYGPNAIVLQPDGEIVVAGTESMGAGVSRGLVRRYDGDGGLLETTGGVPQLDGRGLFESHLDGLLANPDGSVTGAGWTYDSSAAEQGDKVLLAKFVPGAGSEYDPNFGGGVGLVRQAVPTTRQYKPTWGQAIVRDGDKLLVAGRAGGTVMLARFDANGILDQSFGQGGFAVPAIGPGPQPASFSAMSWGSGVAATGGGSSVVVGGTTEWGKWEQTKNGDFCSECPQPLLARFTAGGQLDPGFGSGGTLRLAKPDGGVFEGEAEAVAALADGKLLIRGTIPNQDRGGTAPFVARLNADGSYDPSFGDGGMTVLSFPCTEGSLGQLREQGCYPRALVKARLSGGAKRPRLTFEVSPSELWAGLRQVGLDVPPGLRLSKGFKSRVRVVAAGSTEGNGTVQLMTPKKGPFKQHLLFDEFGQAESLQVTLLPGALRRVGPAKQRRYRLRVSAYFVKDREQYAGSQTISRRVARARH